MNCETHMVPHRAGESGQATLELAAILVGIIAMAVGFLFVAGLSLSDNRTLLEAKKSAEWNARNGRQCPGIRQRTHRLGLRRNHHRAGKHRRAVLVAGPERQHA